MKSFGCADIKMYEMEFIEMAKSPVKYRWFWNTSIANGFLDMLILMRRWYQCLQESNDIQQKS
jgi:hypothetical protein